MAKGIKLVFIDDAVTNNSTRGKLLPFGDVPLKIAKNMQVYVPIVAQTADIVGKQLVKELAKPKAEATAKTKGRYAWEFVGKRVRLSQDQIDAIPEGLLR